jgi:hypothetical protein
VRADGFAACFCRHSYTDAKKNFDKYFAEAASKLGPSKIQPGLEPNAVLSNPGGRGPLVNIEYVLSKGVRAIAVWGPNPKSLSQTHWDSMGAFLHMPWPPPPPPPPPSV